MSDDRTLETLLELDENIFEVGKGYWVRIRARQVTPEPGRPHGIDYSLTLHDPNGNRLLGYDNAHPVRSGRSPSAAHFVRYDHRHLRTSVRRYDYSDAGTLLEDFWSDVEKILEEEGVS